MRVFLERQKVATDPIRANPTPPTRPRFQRGVQTRRRGESRPYQRNDAVEPGQHPVLNVLQRFLANVFGFASRSSRCDGNKLPFVPQPFLPSPHGQTHAFPPSHQNDVVRPSNDIPGGIIHFRADAAMIVMEEVAVENESFHDVLEEEEGRFVFLEERAVFLEEGFGCFSLVLWVLWLLLPPSGGVVFDCVMVFMLRSGNFGRRGRRVGRNRCQIRGFIVLARSQVICLQCSF
mmetsp:Transcript_4176/g.8454  ORF Transcript_4176/g.8454 Transcript_4176/m.8454 type:complete len:233 (+) Transcript_4176:546-1244(+)